MERVQPRPMIRSGLMSASGGGGGGGGAPEWEVMGRRPAGEIGNAFAHLACHQRGRKWRLPDPVNNAFQAFSSN